MSYRLIQGDVLEKSREYPDNHFDGLFCDSPYGIGFMGKEWDHGVPSKEVWAEILRTMKPGAFGLVFGGTRTWHRLAVALEDAGFEIRDTLIWLYGSGFPKSYDISKGIDKAAGAEREVVGSRKLTGNAKYSQSAGGIYNRFEWDNAIIREELDLTTPATPEAKRWHGYGTALKPSWEPVLLIRKPLDGNNVQNALKHGCGGLNIDGSRIPTNGEQPKGSGNPCKEFDPKAIMSGRSGGNNGNVTPPQGRWPANLILDEDSAAMLDAQSGELKSGGGIKHVTQGKEESPTGWKATRNTGSKYNANQGGASRFFYCAKASRTERNAGAMELYWRKDKTRDSGHVQITREEWERLGEEEERIYKETCKRVSLRARGNIHTTVKPLDMVRWLAKLTLPPEREGDPRRLSVPFCGSGSEMIGGLQVGWDMVDGIDIEADYLKIADARLKHWIARMQAKAPLFAEAK